MKNQTCIYKYQPINLNTLTNIVKHQIWCSEPETLNDPLEGNIPFTLIIPDDPEEKEKIIDKVKWNYYGFNKKSSLIWTGIRILRQLNEKKDQVTTDGLLMLIAKLRLREILFNNVRIASFSSKMNKFLLWSHYADGHRGICLEFDKNVGPFSKVKSVEYPELFPIINIEDVFQGKISNPRNNLLLKSIWWKYEDELRLITVDEKNPITYPIEALRAIYLGNAINIDHEKIIISLVKNNFPALDIFRISGVNNNRECDYYKIDIENDTVVSVKSKKNKKIRFE